MGEPTEKTWDGGASTNNWGDAANWNPDGVPGSSDDVTLTGANTINIDVAAQCKTITLNNAGLTLTLLSGNSLTASENFNMSNGTFNTEIGFASVTGSTSITGGTVGYTGTSAQTVAVLTYSNLVFSNSGTKTISSSLSATGNVTINSGATVTVSSSVTFLVNGALTLSGSLANTGTTTIGP